MNDRHKTALATFNARLRESEMFHSGTGQVHKTIRILTAHLDQAEIDHVIIGAMAFTAHGYRREMIGVDVLIRPEGLDAFRDRYVGRGYRPAVAGARKSFRHTETNIQVEFVTAGECPGDGKPQPVAFPDPQTVSVVIDKARIITLPKLVEL